MIIYKITNNINNKIYIGQTIQDINLRWNSHKSLLRKRTHSNEHLQSAWIKYGEDNFIFEIIETVNIELLNEREKYWIEFYDSTNKDKGYNLQSGGNLNRTHSLESRIKMSKRAKGRVKSEEHRRKLSEAGKNKKLSEEHKKKISERMKGKVRSIKHRINISKANKGHSPSQETRKKISEANKLAHQRRKQKP